MNKIELRKKYKNIAAGLTFEYRRSASEAIVEKALSEVRRRNAESIFCFVSTGYEPNTFPIIDALLRDGRRVLVPKCVGKGEMIAVEIKSLNELRPGSYGIPEPQRNDAATDFDLAFVPCLAAGFYSDSQGEKRILRLGHGGGFYDRFFALNSVEERIVLCFSKLLLNTEEEELAPAPFDVDMTGIITEDLKNR